MQGRIINKINQYYQALLEQQRLFYLTGGRVEGPALRVLNSLIDQIKGDFPDLLPPFKPQDYAVRDMLGGYDINAIRAYLASAVGLLKGAIGEPLATPFTEKPNFSFINDPELKEILTRDFLEIQRAYISSCWKSVIILCGGAIEAILTDLLLANESQAKASPKAQKIPDISRWKLSNIIDVCVDLKLVSSGVEKLSHSLREYRNLVHPGNEIRNKLTFDAEEARIALEVLNIVYRDLKP